MVPEPRPVVRGPVKLLPVMAHPVRLGPDIVHDVTICVPPVGPLVMNTVLPEMVIPLGIFHV